MESAFEEFDEKMDTDGWALFKGLLSDQQLEEIRRDIVKSVDFCGELQVNANIGSEPDGTAHHAIGRYESFDNFLENLPLANFIKHYFNNAKFILHAFNPVIVKPGHKSYLHNIHRDVRTYSGNFQYLLNMIVIIDDFTIGNGATHILSGSHKFKEMPDEESFFRNSERLIAPKGSVIIFNPNLWHCAGHNEIDTYRSALTLSFSRAFVKQQMDYPRFLGADWAKSRSEWMREILGYNAMTPQSYEEFYCPPSQRLYKGD